ncbi:hypothetical protein ACP0G2_26760, partial [Escherichia coli]|uniref:hypothetical protein n=1 Tax=Escherichia coli TaxID=562 RepID=UPI003CE95D8C
RPAASDGDARPIMQRDAKSACGARTMASSNILKGHACNGGGKRMTRVDPEEAAVEWFGRLQDCEDEADLGAPARVLPGPKAG